jgi:SRSO17 transposase
MEAILERESPAVGVRERLVGFVEEVAGGMTLARQRENALLYVRGLVEHGGRKSLQPTLFRLEETPARYESLQQFLADSPWDPELLIRACAERVVPQLGMIAWVVDDTGIPKDGKHSPGVKPQYSGTLGKIGNCQITVSVHAAGVRGTLPLGWRLYLPEEWCADPERRQKAKIPEPARFSVYRWVVRCCRGRGLRSGCVVRPSLVSSCNSCASSSWRAGSRARSAAARRRRWGSALWS